MRDKVAQQVMLWEGRRDELAESVRTMAAEVAARHRSQDGAWLDRGLDAAFVEEDFATSRGPLMDPASQPSVG